MAHPVIWYSSDEVGAPTLNNAAGSLINVLDACLLDGFNSKAVTSIVVTGNVATVIASAHGYATGRIVLMAGAAPAGLNGRQKITVTGANTFTFPAPGITNQTATGTITCKRAPLEWTKQFTGTNKAVYARTQIDATAMVLRVDDTYSNTAAAVSMGESATDVDTLIKRAPSAASPKQMYWDKGGNSSSAKDWVLIGDGRTFYLTSNNANWDNQQPGGFGDLVSYKVSDPYGCFIAGSNSDSAGNGPLAAVFNARATFSNADTTFVVARPPWGVGNDVALNLVGCFEGQVTGSSEGPLYPSPVDNGVIVQYPTFVKEYQPSFQYPIRGHLPGMGIFLGNFAASFRRYQALASVNGFPNPMLAVEWCRSSTKGAVAFDLVGPWQ